VAKMEIEKLEDLVKALKEIGYSNRATKEIAKWYT
jgi:predicted Ser/Thr protein kinase